MLQYDVGAASAAGVIAILFANVVAFFLLRVIGRSLEV
jgi:sorbitol/mannitol transport system permease protein